MALHIILLFLGIALWAWLLYNINIFCKVNKEQKILLNSVIEDINSIKDEVKNLKNKY
jgi:biopolymer transport protein ExbB/TolQ